MSPTEIQDRVHAVDRSVPRIDRVAIECALARFFEALGLRMPSLIWARDARTGYLEAGHIGRKARLLEELDSRRNPARTLPRWTRPLDWFRSAPGDSPHRDLMDQKAWTVPEDEALAAVERGWAKPHDPGGGEVWHEPWGRPFSPGLIAMAASKRRLNASDRWSAAWVPLLEAFESGLWLYWLMHRRVIAVPRPILEVQSSRLHSDHGPAVAWPGGAAHWFWRGIQVDRHVIDDPARITIEEIHGERNIEVRRILQERFGHERYLREMRATVVDRDAFGTLYRVRRRGEESLIMVEVLNSTPEPDGSRKKYYLRVPPRIMSPRHAVAWTFGLSESEYLPRVET